MEAVQKNIEKTSGAESVGLVKLFSLSFGAEPAPPMPRG